MLIKKQQTKRNKIRYETITNLVTYYNIELKMYTEDNTLRNNQWITIKNGNFQIKSTYELQYSKNFYK